MRIMTSGDDTAVAVLFNLAYRSRDALGNAWWRLLFLALLRSGLSILAPRYGDADDIEPRWQRWLRWLRTRRISGISATIKDIDPLGIAERVERFERRRWQQRYARDGRRNVIKPDRRMSGGLDTHFLEKAYGWLFAEGYGLPDPAEQAFLLGAFWSHEAWCLRGSADEDDDDFKSRGQLVIPSPGRWHSLRFHRRLQRPMRFGSKCSHSGHEGITRSTHFSPNGSC
jgi:hypothetical protein